MKTHVDRQVKERPILFNAEMVKAILGGRKTQTRRPLKPQPVDVIPKPKNTFSDGRTRWALRTQVEPSRGVMAMCRIGNVGDRLWVRETWQSGEVALNEPRGAVYRATDPDWETMEGWKWKPSIHMPRWASRITLEITGVRVERLRDISEKDALADGGWAYKACPIHKNPQASFFQLWRSIYGIAALDNNPWVWVVEFKRL